MESKELYVRKMFDAIANYYDLANSIMSMGRDHYWRKFTAEMVSQWGARKILDVCAGTGMLALAMARKIKDCQIIGIDYSEQMLKKGRQRLEKYPQGELITLEHGHADNLKFADNSFDCVTLAFSLRNVPDISQVLTEMKRVVRPGGRVLSLELSKPENLLFQKIYYVYFYHLLPLLGRSISGCQEAYRYLPKSLTNFPNRLQLEKLFSQAGLHHVQSYPLTGGIVAVHVGEKSVD